MSNDIVGIDPSSLIQFERAQIDCQVSTAKAFPRNLAAFIRESEEMVGLDRDIAASCIYSVPRANKTISGPSIRLAEILASSYKNLHIANRIISIDKNSVVVEAVAWDLENNNKFSSQSRRRIPSPKNGGNPTEDMINTTTQAALSIAIRNTIFKVIPRAFVDKLYKKAIEVSTAPLQSKGGIDLIHKALEWFERNGVPSQKIFNFYGILKAEDITQDIFAELVGAKNALVDKSLTAKDAFSLEEIGESADLEKARELQKEMMDTDEV